MKKRIAIVGGSCIDVFATSTLPLVAHDSNPGIVNIGFGGVGRNIAENLARLEQDALLIAPFGLDPLSAHMLQYTESTGVYTDHSLLAEDCNAPYYISINDHGGDMAVAVNDMAICEQITPEFLSTKLAVLNTCDGIIVDTNIPMQSIEWLAVHCVPPLLAEAVSTHKAIKLVQVLPYLHAIKTNLLEAETLLGTNVLLDQSSLQAAANRFHAIGILHVLITLGKAGAFYSFNQKQLFKGAYHTNTVNTNGCGDAFCAAAFLGVLCHKSPEALLAEALAAAAITAESKDAVSTEMCPNSINSFLHEMRNTL